MVGMVQSRWANRAVGLLNSAKSCGDIASQMEQLRQLREVLLNRDSTLLPEFTPRLTELDVQLPAAARKLLIEILGEIGKKHLELLPEIISSLVVFLKDETPPVTRQAILTGTSLFCNTLVKVAIQGLNSSELNETLKSSWSSMLKFKDSVLPLAFQPGIDGVRLLAVKFIEAMILLYTPDTTLPSDPPQECDGLQFNISWLKGGHPFLNVGDLAIEAGQNLRLLLDQLKFPKVKSISTSIVIVLINSLSTIAKTRPSFYGRILPVLLSLDPEMSVVKGVQVPGAQHALKNAFMRCLQCTHSSATPWRARLVEALRVMDIGEPRDQPVKHEKRHDTPAIGMDVCESSKLKDDKSLLHTSDEIHTDLGRKRSLDKVPHSELADVISEKRIRQSPTINDSVHCVPVKNDPSACDSVPSNRDGDSGPVLQLVGMFGALVAQGKKASEPLEILISSISSDLLAEVVMANMRYLPSSCPKSDYEDESTHFTNNVSGLESSVSASNAFSLTSAFSLITSQLNSQSLLSQDKDTVHIKLEEDAITKEDNTVTSSGTDHSLIAPDMHTSATSSFFIEKNDAALQLYGNCSETVESKIPGLNSVTSFNETQELPEASLAIDEIKEPILEHAISSGVTVSLDISPSTSTVSYTLETLSPRAIVTEASEAPSSSSLPSSSHYLLPKMVACNVDLSYDQKDQLQKVAFLRIIEAYKQVAVSGGSSVHLSLLAHLGTEFPLDLDPWGLMQKHVVSDYVNHQGHELTLRVLYRLYREAEQDQDFLSSRTATSVYETFLLNVAEALRDSFPAIDKSLGRLLGEVPYLSEGVLKMLECLCSPESKEKQDTDFQSGDRVTQGLIAVWNLILIRPSNRDRCLQIVLQSTVHLMEEVRMKAIRLVANKLFPMSSISQKIEDFATENLHLVLDNIPSSDDTAANESSPTLQKESDLVKPSSSGPLPSSAVNIESLADGLSIKSAESSSFSEAQRCMSLYFALCTKKHSLLHQIFSIYRRIPKAVIEAVHRHIPILVRTIGSSPELLNIVSDPPSGSENLLMQVLHILTDGTVPSQELISSVRASYNSKLKDVEILIPILSFLSKDEILPLIPQLVNLPLDKFQVAITRILQGSSQSGDSLTPAEVLISIHGIDFEKDGVPLKKIMDACSTCFEQRSVFTQPVLAKVLNQLVEQTPLPLLFMRTVIQAIGIFPGLVDFVMEILSRLVNKQIWKYPKLWIGFLKCAVQTKPQSFNVLLQLPAAQLENALNKNPVLKPPLVEHANQPNIRSTLPRSTLVVLGLENDPQRSSQVQQSSQSQAADTASSTSVPANELTQ